MDRNYVVKVSMVLSNREISVLKSALKGYILTTTYEECTNTAKELLEMITNADDRAKRLSKLKNS